MPKRLISKIKRFWEKNSDSNKVRANVYAMDEHLFRPEDISPAAIRVVETLNQGGYEAYLVGGCVRDSLIGKIPKDFDVATNAHPEEIKALFRNCRLIGRRFRLAHVRFGREVIEVATFRGNHDNSDDNDQTQSAQSDAGLLLRDNVFGSLDEDAIRRDFTINALYYRHSDHSILDFVGGWEDIQQRQLRLIGDPEKRYREDPVRMLRAIRFAAKLDFTLTEEIERPIREHAELLGHIPPARLFEEVLKLFLSGEASNVWRLLNHYHLAQWLFPASVPETNTHPGTEAMINQVMINTDERIALEKPVTPAFLYAVMLWGPLQTHWKNFQDEGIPPVPAYQKAIQRTLYDQTGYTTIPKRFVIPLREIWELQVRLPKCNGKRAEQLFEHPRFRAAYDLLLLREAGGETKPGLGEWWTRYQEVDAEERKAMANAAPQGPKKRGGNRNRRRAPRKKPQNK